MLAHCWYDTVRNFKLPPHTYHLSASPEWRCCWVLISLVAPFNQSPSYFSKSCIPIYVVGVANVNGFCRFNMAPRSHPSLEFAVGNLQSYSEDGAVDCSKTRQKSRPRSVICRRAIPRPAAQAPPRRKLEKQQRE